MSRGECVEGVKAGRSQAVSWEDPPGHRRGSALRVWADLLSRHHWSMYCLTILKLVNTPPHPTTTTQEPRRGALDFLNVSAAPWLEEEQDRCLGISPGTRCRHHMSVSTTPILQINKLKLRELDLLELMTV